jgi:hypothetical protein
VNAGVDVLLDPQEPLKVFEYLCQVVENGKLDVRRVDEACGRIVQLKQRILAAPKVSASDETTSLKALAERVARSAIETVGPTSNALPLNRDESLGVLLLKTFDRPNDPPEQPLAAALQNRFRDVRYLQLGPRSDATDYDTARRIATEAAQLLIAVIVRPAAWNAFGLRPEQRELVDELTRQRPAVLASLGVPYVLSDYPQSTVRICTYSDVPASQQALAEFLTTP